jgi:hypothetical protein
MLVLADKTQRLNVKLGLWEMTGTGDRNSVASLRSIAPGLLAKMTPEQRTRAEAKLKARAAQRPRIDTKRFCLTQEKLDSGAFSGESSKLCQRTIVNSTSRVTQVREQCEDNGVKRTLDGHFEALDPEAMKGSLRIKVEGKNPQTENVDIAMKWIGADCGDTAVGSSYSKR